MICEKCNEEINKEEAIKALQGIIEWLKHPNYRIDKIQDGFDNEGSKIVISYSKVNEDLLT